MSNPKQQNATNLNMEGIRDGHYVEAINKSTGDRYTQYSTGVKDGRKGFIEFFSDFIQRNPKRDIRVVRSFVDGQYVFVKAYQSVNDSEYEYVTTDFFDKDVNDIIIEHWDVIAEYAGKSPSGHTAIDGPSEITDLDKTEENKQLVRDLIFHGLMVRGDPSKITDYISKEQYIQHNKEVPDGVEHFVQLASDPNRPLNYKRIVLLVGQGNFVRHWVKPIGTTAQSTRTMLKWIFSELKMEKSLSTGTM